MLQGKELKPLDLGIKNDKIEAVGDLSGENAEIVIDASGKYVSPGFIDLTSHSDTHWTLFNAPGQESLLAQGITTILGGNCGISLAPLVRASDIEGIGKWVDTREININWHNLSEFFDELSKRPLGVNFLTLVGHGTLRRGILGDNVREMSERELEQMVFVLKRAMEEGAFGISTSLASAHAKYASDEELRAVFRTAAQYGGITKHHLKDEGKNILPALAELLALGRKEKAKIHFSHFKLLGRKSQELLPEALSMIEVFRQDGNLATLDVFPYTRTGSLLYLFLPDWVVEVGRARILALLEDEATKKNVIEHLKSLTLHYDRIIVAATLKDASAIGKTIKELSDTSGLSPEEVILELIKVNQLHVSIFSEVISEENLEEIISKDYALLASDGVGYNLKTSAHFDLPHPRSFGSFPRALEIFAKKKNVISWPELLYKFSEYPAALLGLKDRGRISRGFFADIVILDPLKIGSSPDYTSVHHDVEGIDWVFVNGKVSLKNGILSGELNGKIIKRN